MPDDILRQEIEVRVSAQVDESLSRLNKGLGTITETSNKMASGIISNFQTMGKQIENSTKSLNLGATFKSYFDNIAKSSAASFGEVKNHLNFIEGAFGKLNSLSKEKVKVTVDSEVASQALSKLDKKIAETQKILEQLRKQNVPMGAKGANAFAKLDEYNMLKSSFETSKLEAMLQLDTIEAKTISILSQVYTRTGQLANSIIDQLAINAKRISSMIGEVAESQVMSLKRMQGMTGQFSPDTKNILVNKSLIDSAKREYSELNTYVTGLQKQLTEAIRAEQIARFAYDKQYTGEAKEQNKLLWEETVKNLKEITEEHKKAAASMNELSKAIGSGQITQKRDIARVQKAYGQGGLKYAMGFTVEELEAEGGRLKKELKTLYDEMISISKNYSKQSVARGRAILPEFENIKGEFESIKNLVSRKIQELRLLTSKGIINATPDIVALEQLESKFTQYAASIRNQSAGLGKIIRAQGEQASKGFFTNFWEGFRNLRWQVAAAAYMFNYFVRTIVQNFDEALNKISEFNKEVFGLAATIGISMGSIGPQFNKVFDYSAEVLTKLQAAAAGTYLKMEDLQMIVRTFAMHGMFPKSDQDIKSLVTIASGVKVLTEGMANEGVQMRQEIDALLSGRQRVTDTLARTFKNAGIDIKAEMQKWQAEGISAMQGLARAMQPLAEMNERVIDQYAAQKNLLKANYDYIQRVYLTGLHEVVAKYLSDVNKNLGKPGEYIGETGKAVGQAILLWNTALATFGNELLNAVTVILDSFSALGQVFVGKEGLAGGMEFILKTVYLISYGFSSIVNTLTYILNISKSILQVLYGVGEIAVFQFKKGMENVADGFKNYGLSIKLYYDAMDKSSDRFVENWTGASKVVDKITSKLNPNTNNMQSMSKTLDIAGAISNLKQLETQLTKIKDKYSGKDDKLENELNNMWEMYSAGMVAVNEALGKLSKDEKTIFKEIRNSAKETKDGILSDYTDLNSDMTALVAHFKDQIAMSGTGGVQVPSGMRVRPVKSKEQPKMESLEDERDLFGLYMDNLRKKEKLLSDVLKDTNLALDAQAAIVDKLAHGGKTLTDMWDEYIALMERINGIDPFTKTTLQYHKMYADIEKMAQTNVYLSDPESIAQMKLQADKWYASESLKVYYDYTDKIKDTMRRMVAANQTEFEKINEDIDNLIRTAEKDFFWNPQKIEDMKKWGELQRTIRTTKAELEQLREVANEQINVAGLAADLLGKSYGVQGQQLGQLLKLQADYNKNIMDAAEKIRAFGDKWGYGSEKFNEYSATVQEGLKLQESLMEYQKERVMNPFFADLEQMSKGWVDTLSDGISDIIMDFDKLGETADKIFKDITKQVLNAFIKRQLIEPLAGQLGGLGVFKQSDQSIQAQTMQYMAKMQQMQTTNQSYLTDVISGKFGPTALGATPATAMWVQIVGASPGFLPGAGGGSNMMGNVPWESKLAGDFGFTPDKEMQGMSYFVSQGFTPAQAAGIMGNYKYESAGLNPAINEFGGGGGFGLAQWTGPRKIDLQNFAGPNFSDYQAQLEFTMFELQNKEKLAMSKLLETNTPSEGALSFSKYFERPGIPNNNIRQQYAEDIFTKYQQQNSQAMTQFTNSLNTGTESLGGFDKGLDTSVTSLGQLDKAITLPGIGESNLSSPLSSAGGLASTTGVINITAQMVNVNGGISGAGGLPGTSGASSAASVNSTCNGVFSNVTSGLKSMASSIFNTFKGLIGGVFDVIKSLVSGIGSLLGSLGSGISGGMGGLGGLFGGLFGGGSSAASPFAMVGTYEGFAEGGVLKEPVFGVGLNSGTKYSFGEKEAEIFMPESKLKKSNTQVSREASIEYHVHMGGIQISAIDTQTGGEFLLKNGDVIQAMMMKQLKNNKQIRRAIPNSY